MKNDNTLALNHKKQVGESYLLAIKNLTNIEFKCLAKLSQAWTLPIQGPTKSYAGTLVVVWCKHCYLRRKYLDEE